MAEVFISYARANEAVAKRVANGLKASGLDVWFDEQLPAHRAYSEIIEQKLRSANAVVVLWSTEAAQSQWVRAEADFARANVKLVQAQLDDTLPPLPFNQIQCADLRGWRGHRKHRGWTKLAQSVSSVVAGEAPQAAEPASAPGRARFDRRHAMAALAGLLILVAAAIFLLPRLIGGGGDLPKVAVLPFKSVGGSDEALVAGIWEDTRQALSRNPQLLVLGPNTSEELAKRGTGATRRAADYLLQASVRSAGDRIRINTNLVRAKDGAQIWSENFDRKLDDVFALQSEIAQEIEGRIRGRLARSGGVQPENIATSGEVYALYSDARSKIRRRNFEYAAALEQLEEVVRRDPNFAPGWATLAVVKAFFGEGEWARMKSAEADARRAIALAPNLAAGHAALGFVLRTGPAAEATLRRAIALDPNDFEALNWLANSLDRTRVDEKLQLYSRIVEIEPLFWPAITNKLNLLRETGSLDAIEQELKRVERLGDERLATILKMAIAEDKADFSQAVAVGLDYYRRASPGDDRALVGQFLISPLFRIGLPEVGDHISPPISDFVPFIRKNDPKAIEMMEEQHSAQSYWTFGYLPIVGTRVYLLNGQGPRLAKRYWAVVKTPEEFEDLVGKPSFPDIAPGVALALRSAGDEGEAQRLLALAERGAAAYPAKGLDQEIRFARIYAVQGRKDQAMVRLLTAVRRGWFPPFLPIHTDIALDPPLAELKSDPRFEQIRQQILRHIAKERRELGPVNLDDAGPARKAA